MGLQTVQQTVLLTTLATAATVIGTLLYKRWQKERIPLNWEKIGTVTKVHLYPLKSGRRMELDRVECTEVGVKQTKEDGKGFQLRDRALVVYGARDNEFRTARTYPKMILIDVTVHDETHLAIDAPTMNTLYVKIPNRQDNTVTSVKCWKNELIDAIDCGDEAATWLSRYIMERDWGLRLGYSDASRSRNITKTHQKLLKYYKNLTNQSTGLFSDLTSIHLINQVSVNDMNKKIGDSTISVEYLRPNIVVDGVDLQPYVEDKWDYIKIGDDVVLRNVKECTRCILTSINPTTAERGREPLKTLKTYRLSTGPDKYPVMGIHMGVKQTGFLSVGDAVYVPKGTHTGKTN